MSYGVRQQDARLDKDEVREIAHWIGQVVDGLAQNGEDANANTRVRGEVSKMGEKFPIYISDNSVADAT